MTRLILPTLLAFALVVGCQDETTSVSKDPDSSEPEECEPPAEYFWRGCPSSFDADIPTIRGCYIPCLDNPCPEGLECQERVIDPCANLGCKNCHGIVDVCVEP